MSPVCELGFVPEKCDGTYQAAEFQDQSFTTCPAHRMTSRRTKVLFEPLHSAVKLEEARRQFGPRHVLEDGGAKRGVRLEHG